MSNTASVSRISSFASTSRENSQDGIRCKICGTVLTDEAFYQNHLKSKKHRVNLKVARRAVHEKSKIEQTPVTDEEVEADDVLLQIENPLETVEFSGLSDYKTKRETYRPRDEKNFEDHYNLYKNSLIAYWSINLSFNPTVQDFKISTGDKKWENFGDVVVDIEFKDLPGRGAHTIRCAIQFKQIASHNMKILQPFEKGPFSYEAIARQIEKINNKSNGNIVDDTRYITFSTSLLDPALIASVPVNFCDICRKITIACKCPNKESSKTVNLTARTRSIKQNVILNTSEDNDTVFSFICTQGQYDLPKIYVYSCQKKAREFPVVVEEIISDCFGENRPNVAKDFVKFIEIWSNGQCGGYYKLRKEDVLVRLGQILLGKFRVTPELMTIEDPVSRFSTWIQALKTTDITLLKPTTNLSPLIEPFNLIIQKIFKKTINTTNETISFKRMKSDDEVKHLTDPVLRGYVYEETKRDLENSILLERVYLMFWKAGLMPLMLEVANKLDQDYVFRVINELKSVGLTRRYLVKTNQNIQQNALNVFKFVDFFINLGNISKKLGANVLANVKIRLRDELSLSLAAIEQWDVLFKKTVTPEEFFHMALGNYSFRTYNGVKEEHTNSKIVLERDLMETLKKQVQSEQELNNKIWLRGVNPDWFS